MKQKTKKKGNMYFDQAAEDAIIAYNNTDSVEEKSKLYKEFIEYPFYKLSENLINRYKFPYFHESVSDIQNKVVSFMVSKMDRYNQKNGKAFSFFHVIGFRYLVSQNMKKYEYQKQHHSINDSENGFDIMDEFDPYDNEMDEFMKLFLQFWNNNLTVVFTNPVDIQVAGAVIELFHRAKNIENFNKKQLYIFIREMTGVRTQYITRIVNKMNHYVEWMMTEYQNEGTFDVSTISFFDIIAE